jgi:hypothetical protein
MELSGGARRAGDDGCHDNHEVSRSGREHGPRAAHVGLVAQCTVDVDAHVLSLQGCSAIVPARVLDE